MNPALNSSVKMDWQTPDCVLERVRKVGPIILDPCTVSSNPTGARVFHAHDLGADGLALGWETGSEGIVYVNPPYGRALSAWVDCCVSWHVRRGLEIALLTPARTDTKWWRKAMEACDAVALWSGRLKFRGAKDPAPFPSCVFYFGTNDVAFIAAFRDAALVIPGGYY